MAESTVPQQTLVVAGLPVHIFTRVPLDTVSGKVAVFFFLHGRLSKSANLEPIVQGLFRRLATGHGYGSTQGGKELVVVTFVSRPIHVALFYFERVIDDAIHLRCRTNGTMARDWSIQSLTKHGKRETNVMRKFFIRLLLPRADHEDAVIMPMATGSIVSTCTPFKVGDNAELQICTPFPDGN